MKEKIIVIAPHQSPRLPLKRHVLALTCCGFLGLAAGCTTAGTSHRVSAPPPPTPTKSMTTTTTTTPVTVQPVAVSSPASSTTTVVTQIPPALQQEVPIAQPSASHIWLAGFWTWRNDRYEWMSGHWELPPSQRSTWVAPRWDKSGKSYRFYEGYWN